MSDFKAPRKKNKRDKDMKSIEDFAKGASIHMNPEKIKEGLESFYTRLNPNVKKIIQAVAFDNRISQREVIEEGVARLIETDPERVKKALKRYKEHQKTSYETPDVSDIFDRVMD